MPTWCANIAARAAAAKPRLPTPAIPASPPVFVSISTCIDGEPCGDIIPPMGMDGCCPYPRIPGGDWGPTLTFKFSGGPRDGPACGAGVALLVEYMTSGSGAAVAALGRRDSGAVFARGAVMGGLDCAGCRPPGGSERMLAADGARMGIACMWGGAVAGGEVGPGGILATGTCPLNRAGSDDVRLSGATGLGVGVGSEGWYRGDSGEVTLGEGVDAPGRAGASDGSGREGNTTLDVSGVALRASGLGTRSGRDCAFGTFKGATEGWRGTCDVDPGEVGGGGAGLCPRCTPSGVP